MQLFVVSIPQAALAPYSVTVKLDCGADFPPTDSLSEDAAVATIAVATGDMRRRRGDKKKEDGPPPLISKSRRNYKGYQPLWNEDFILSLTEKDPELAIRV